MKLLRLVSIALLLTLAVIPAVHHHALVSMQGGPGSHAAPNLCAGCLHGKVVIADDIALCENDTPRETIATVVVSLPGLVQISPLASRAPPLPA